MTRPAHVSPRLEALVDRVCNGQIDATEFDELAELIRDDAAARWFYIESMDLHASLRKSRLPAMRAPGRAGAARAAPETVTAAGDLGTFDRSGSSGARQAWRSDRLWQRWAARAIATAQHAGSVDRPASSSWRPPKQTNHPGGRWAAGAIAATLLFAGMIALWAGRGRAPRSEADQAPVATIVASEGARWSGPADSAQHVGDALRVGQSLRLDAGTVRLWFRADASVTLEGPAELELRSAMRVRVLRGKVTTRVGSGAKGFTVETRRAEVVDLGTEFGLEVDAAGRTDVVVFQGAVDLSYDTARDVARGQARLTQGEALRLGPGGDASRIVSVERRPDGGRWSTGSATGIDAVIQEVSDNIRGLDSNKYYQIVPRGLHEDVPAYVDRPHQWNGVDGQGLPEPLRLADYIMPFNADKNARDLRISITLARAATLFVLFDDRAEVPPWLADQFTDTGWKVGLDEGPSPQKTLEVDQGPGQSIDAVFSVWKRAFPAAETVTLGAMVDQSPGKAMYGIAATPLLTE